MGALLADLVAFLQEHRDCGELEAGKESGRFTMSCTCSAAIVRRTAPSEVEPRSPIR
jgi:hypothetical protein